MEVIFKYLIYAMQNNMQKWCLKDDLIILKYFLVHQFLNFLNSSEQGRYPLTLLICIKDTLNFLTTFMLT